MKRNAESGAWITLGSVNDFPIGETRLVDSSARYGAWDDGETAKIACWVRRISASSSRSSPSIARISVAQCAGSPSPSYSCVPAMAEPTTKMAPEPPGRRNVGFSSIGISSIGKSISIHAGDMPTLATQASCSETKKPLMQILPGAPRPNRHRPLRGPRHGRPENKLASAGLKAYRWVEHRLGLVKPLSRSRRTSHARQQCELDVCLRQCRHSPAYPAGRHRNFACAGLQPLCERSMGKPERPRTTTSPSAGISALCTAGVRTS